MARKSKPVDGAPTATPKKVQISKAQCEAIAAMLRRVASANHGAPTEAKAHAFERVLGFFEGGTAAGVSIDPV